MEQGHVVEEEDVALLPLELDALLVEDLAASLHHVVRDLGPIGHRGRADLLPVHPHHRVVPHPPPFSSLEHPREGSWADDRLQSTVGQPFHSIHL
ncbi:hypothetical protein EUGRSUZ_B03061 [Eucalyptus grandis]|uniref:Uncharacterized protein n=2 Tax=Eucalyptus grandis TaxID=71139 RepID=A0ACC3LV53_EUCGR|nr:hypothetical protein EUGRSUZ_B03061 [Eucalyptus grandis]